MEDEDSRIPLEGRIQMTTAKAMRAPLRQPPDQEALFPDLLARSAGRGPLLARGPIHRGEVVLVLGGRVIGDEELRRLSPHSSLAIGEGLNLVQGQDDLAQFVNHSCDPSLWIEDEATLSARSEIATGKEITVDYALMTVGPTWQMPCACGSPLCRRRVTGADWQLSQLQGRYAGHFSPFINDRIDRLKGSTRDA
jgi:hypothetical protein